MHHFRINKAIKAKKKFDGQSVSLDRSKLPPPPPPPPGVSTAEEPAAGAKDSATTSHGAHDPPETDGVDQRKLKNTKSQSDLHRKSSSKKKKRGSSDSSAKFYVSLDTQPNDDGSHSIDDKGNLEECRSDEVPSVMASGYSETKQCLKEGMAGTEALNDSQEQDNDVDRGIHKRKPRQLPAIPIDGTTVSMCRGPAVPKMQSNTENGITETESFITAKNGSSESTSIKKPTGIVVQYSGNEIHPKHDDTSRHDKLTPPPQPPVRRKKKHRIVTQDIPSNLSLPYTIDSDLTDSSTGSLDNLVQANMTYCTESNDSNTGVQTGMDTAQKQPQGSTPPTAKKPQILRPKPKINAHRPKISSFTMEDMDICQDARPGNACRDDHITTAGSRLSRRDEMSMGAGDKSSKRRSKSVGMLDVDQVLRRLRKPAVPQKPKFSPKSSSNESLDRPITAPKPKRKLPVPPKPTALVTVDKGPKDDMTSCSGEDHSEIPRPSNYNKNVGCASRLDNIHECAQVEDDGSAEKPPIKVVGFSQVDAQQTVVDNVKQSAHKQSASSENQQELSSNSAADSEKLQGVKHKTGTISRKVSRKQSARGMTRKYKSFRCRVYEDVELKDEIMDGEEEDLNFSESDLDSSISDDSLTDEDGLQFEQEQAAMLGLSPVKEITDSQPSSPVSEEPKDKLYQIAKELLDTERAYMAKLKLLDQVFHRRVIIDNREHHFLPESLIPQLFINIKSIYQFHDFLLKQLEERMNKWESVKKIGDVMMKWAPFLKLYTEYINRFNHAMNTFNMCMEKYPRFASIVEEIQSMPECGMLLLQHHMLEPIQRVPRYELLLRDYLKHLPEDSPDRADTTKALDLIAKAAEHANEMIKKNEHSDKLLNICEKLIGASHLNLISPTRQLLKEGSIVKLSARDASHQERYLFLFNDYLLVCVPVTLPKLLKHHYKVKDKLDIEGMRVMEGDDLYTPNTFLVKSKTRSIEFHTVTAEEKDDWQAAIWSTIAEYTKKQMSRMTGSLLTETFEKEELGKRAPTWVKDQAASMCMLCAREFTTFFRRHHCRACGRVICGLCSARKARLVYDGEKYNRVCDNCYNVLELKLNPSEVQSRGNQRRNKTLRGVKASDPSIISGYLLMSQNKKNWEKRYFAVRDDFVLYSFKAHEDLFAMTSLPLPGYIIGQTKNENQLKDRHVFKLFHVGLKKEYYFQAEDKTSLNRWLTVLEKLVRAELPDVVDATSPPTTPNTSPYTVKLTA